MGGSIFDTNKLIRQWHRRRGGRPYAELSRDDVESWAEDLIAIYRTHNILTPIYIEFVGGVVNRPEMELSRAFLSRFSVLDGGSILPEDWSEARRLAERIPHNPKPRGAIDCLIRAIAIRLKCELLTDDGGMPHR